VDIEAQAESEIDVASFKRYPLLVVQADVRDLQADQVIPVTNPIEATGGCQAPPTATLSSAF
jgi:hypothetical protein